VLLSLYLVLVNIRFVVVEELTARDRQRSRHLRHVLPDGKSWLEAGIATVEKQNKDLKAKSAELEVV